MSQDAMFRLALRVSPQPISLSRLSDGAIVDVSDSFCRMTGHARQDLVGRRIADLDLWVDPAQREALVEAVHRHGQVQDFEAIVRTRDGEIRTYLIGATRVDAQPEPLLLTIGHDVTDRQRIAQALRESEQRYRALFEAMPLGVLITQHGDIKFGNRKAAEMSGYDLGELVGKSFLPMIHEDDRDRVSSLHRRRMAGESDVSVYDIRVRRKNGILRHWRLHVQTVDWFGAPSGLSLLIDITEQVEAEEGLRELSNIVEQTSDGIMLTATDGTIQYVNPGFEKMTGYRSEELLGRTPATFKSGAHDAQFYRQLWETIQSGKPFHAQVVNQRKDGGLYHAVKTITPMFDAKGRITRYVNIDKDFTAQHEAQQRANFLATHDYLTGLANRALLNDRVGQAIARHSREAVPFALLFMDLDGFKSINDLNGHQAGDHVLKEVAKRLLSRVRGVDTVARIGGDEFVVLLEGVAERDAASRIAAELAGAVREPIRLPADEICEIGVSVGISAYPADGPDADAIMRAADRAMYQAKREGESRV